MDKIEEILTKNWFFALAFLAIALILLLVVIILAIKVKKQAQIIRMERAERAEEPQRTTALLEETAATSLSIGKLDDDEEDDALEVIEREDNNIEVKDKSGGGYVVAYDSSKGDWTIRKKGAERATRRVATKEEAMKIAKELSRKHNVALIVKKKDGRFQKHY